MRATYLDKIDAMGGMLKAIERGYVQQEIQNAAYEYQQAVDRKEAIVVGVNAFALDAGKADSAAAHRRIAGAQAGGAAARPARQARPGEVAGRRQAGGRHAPAALKPDARNRRGRRSQRHRRRNLRRHAARVWRVPRDGGDLRGGHHRSEEPQCLSEKGAALAPRSN